MGQPQVYTSPLIIATVDNIIRTGAIAVDSTAILEVGRELEIRTKYPEARVSECRGVLLPPLVNCHIHLELSHLTGVDRPGEGKGMVSWIKELMHHRQLDQSTREGRESAAAKVVEKQYRQGVILLNDIGNAVDYSYGNPQYAPEILRTLEMVAPTGIRTEEMKKLIAELPDDLPVSPHAPYSTTAELIQVLKKRANVNNQVIAIHLAESTPEIALLRTAEGPFRQFLEERDSWDYMLTKGETFAGGIHYLNQLDVLDEKTLVVHCVHVDESELTIIAEKGVKICLCPGSNQFLRVGLAPLTKMLEKNILPGIGTDSLTSNEDLDMWREMQILRQSHPEVSSAAILAMATIGGASALGREDDFGTLEPGKKPYILEIALPDIEGGETDILNHLASAGQPETINWLTPAKLA